MIGLTIKEIRVYFSVGMSEMPMGKFIVYTLCGSAIWNTILICAGYKLGSNWEYFLTILDKYKIIVIIVIIILIIFIIYRRKSKK